jgi:hypothetical protein
MNVNYCQTEFRSASLATALGRELAQAWFGFDNDILAALVGRYSRGKNKGKLRGEVTWKRCVRGGWNGQGVTLPGAIFERAIVIGGFISPGGHLCKPAEIVFKEK